MEVEVVVEWSGGVRIRLGVYRCVFLAGSWAVGGITSKTCDLPGIRTFDKEPLPTGMRRRGALAYHGAAEEERAETGAGVQWLLLSCCLAAVRSTGNRRRRHEV